MSVRTQDSARKDTSGDLQAQTRELAIALGRKVRLLRSRRRMTRRDLSRKTEISERYLSEVEKGRANPTLALLLRIASTLNEPLATFVPAETQDQAISPPLADLLIRMGPEKQASLYRRLLREGTDGGGSQQGVALVGMRGSGKSTLGKLLADTRKVPFVRLTDVIQDLAGMSTGELLELMGPGAYRRLERRALEAVIERHRVAVVEAGGGLVMEHDTFNRLMQSYRTVWMTASPDELMQRVRDQGDLRPMAGSDHALDELRLIMREREAYYAQADHSLDTSGKSVQESLCELVGITEGAFRGNQGRAR